MRNHIFALAAFSLLENAVAWPSRTLFYPPLKTNLEALTR